MKKFSKEVDNNPEWLLPQKTIFDSFERISDSFISLDKNSCYNYVNHRTYQLFNTSSDKLIGKNIWDVYPELIGTPFYQTFQEAMETQEFKSISRYSELFSFWYECYFYPASDGMSIFVRDNSVLKRNFYILIFNLL